jgi:hypothetical protein
VTIKNSGSTNAPGFILTVTPDGQATWHLDPPKNLPNPLPCSTTNGTTTLDASLTKTLFTDLVAAEPFANRTFNACPKSVSLGTTTSVAFAGQSVPDVECGSSTDSLAQAITLDTQNVEAAVSALCH